MEIVPAKFYDGESCPIELSVFLFALW